MEMMLSLACMMNEERPSARLGRTIFRLRRIDLIRSLRCVFLPHRNSSTHAQDRACEMMVAQAAPATPMLKPKMKMGSSTMLATAPMSTESMPVLAKPCAVMNAFMPSVI